MTKMVTLSRLKAIVATTAMLSIGIFAANAYANNSWGGYHWARTSSPFTLKLVDSVTADWNSYLGVTSTDWSASTVLNTTIVAGNDSSSTRKRCPAVLGKDRVCNAAYGNNGWLGLAQVWVYSDGHIAQGVVKLNDTYFNTSTYNTPAWRKLVMCQEVGHTLGLSHVDEIFNNTNLGTCMDYTNDPSTNQHPNQHDYDQLDITYGHIDSSTTVSQTTANRGNINGAGQNLDLDNPSAWGKVLKQDSRGRNSLYERNLGNGEKLFTFVTWAE